MAIETKEDTPCCGVCGASGVRLYRSGGGFYHPEDNRCNQHVTELQQGWYLPLRLDTDGSVWGHCSGPQESVDAFFALPEADPNGASYDPQRGWRTTSKKGGE